MTSTPKSQASSTHSTSSYLSYPVSHVVSGLYRRLTDPSPSSSNAASRSQPPPSLDTHQALNTPPRRTASPFQPPPLTPLSLTGIPGSSPESAQVLSRTLAEEIRLLVPPRLQLAETWSLVYSLENDGVSLATLYNKCAAPTVPKRGSFVLAVKDAAGGTFGAYLTDPPHPSASYYGTGECFLWRASVLPTSAILSSLPPPPSAPTDDTLGRSTTIVSPTRTSLLSPSAATSGHDPTRSGTSTPERIRFKAFPYSGVNDYLIFCEHDFLSVGGGDGKYGLWLDGILEKGVSSPSMTFGNEGLSEEGEKFEIVGVEVWCIGD
ncbi:MAG: oxidation resistance protein 1 [Heterodermia speciosa]|uniref:Oxidation resistance protein 1 n=1 Tax=Heterodermia speciosa TaxID=116794 RepID=A0A8H3F4T3_9LECA|nr:MAG: oxidation resistance protein 1 [Heterodermia speciosa]